MYQEITDNLSKQLSEKEFERIKKSKWHLGIFTEPYLTNMLEGRKTIESRFSKNKIVPYGKVSSHDIVFVKKSGGDVLAYFEVKEVLSFDLKEMPISKIKEKYNDRLFCPPDFWEAKSTSNYATLIIIDKITFLKPFHISKKGMQTWVILN